MFAKTNMILRLPLAGHERVRAVEEVKEMYVFASQAIAEGQE